MTTKMLSTPAEMQAFAATLVSAYETGDMETVAAIRSTCEPDELVAGMLLVVRTLLLADALATDSTLEETARRHQSVALDAVAYQLANPRRR